MKTAREIEAELRARRGGGENPPPAERIELPGGDIAPHRLREFAEALFEEAARNAVSTGVSRARLYGVLQAVFAQVDGAKSPAEQLGEPRVHADGAL